MKMFLCDTPTQKVDGKAVTIMHLLILYPTPELRNKCKIYPLDEADVK